MNVSDGRADEETKGGMRYVGMVQQGFVDFSERHGRTVKYSFGLLVIFTLHIFLGFAIGYQFSTALALLALMAVAYFLIGYFVVLKPYFAKSIGEASEPILEGLVNVWNIRFVPLSVDHFFPLFSSVRI